MLCGTQWGANEGSDRKAIGDQRLWLYTDFNSQMNRDQPFAGCDARVAVS